jgi:hypothetical protein
MLADESYSDNPGFMVDVNGVRLLRTVSVYGANASGKSNFFKALSDMFWNICSDREYLTGETFAFDGKLQNKPIMCEVSFCLPAKQTKVITEYKYGYEIKNDEVISEWLVKRKLGSKDDFADVFHRKGSSLEFGNGNSYKAVEPLRATLGKTRKTLFLRIAGRTDAEPFSTIYNWCFSSRVADFFSDDAKKMKERIKYLARILADNKNYLERFLEFMQKFDPCIQGVSIEEDRTTDTGFEIFVQHTMHNHNNGPYRKVSIFKESEGTQKLASIFNLIMKTLSSGGIAIVDELDTKLHPLILRELVKLFRNNEYNRGRSQLVFSAHNLVALNSQDMRADEIYFVKKDLNGYSSIERLSSGETDDESIITDREYGMAYLAGRFGAVPTDFAF